MMKSSLLLLMLEPISSQLTLPSTFLPVETPLKNVRENISVPVTANSGSGAFVEIYPGAAQDIWKIVRKQGGLKKLANGLEKLGLKGLRKRRNGDELDAITGAVVGRLYLKNQAEVLGNFAEGAIVFPKAN